MREVESSYATCSLHLEEGESWYPFKLSVCLSVRPSVTTGRLSKKETEPKKRWLGCRWDHSARHCPVVVIRGLFFLAGDKKKGPPKKRGGVGCVCIELKLSSNED